MNSSLAAAVWLASTAPIAIEPTPPSALDQIVAAQGAGSESAAFAQSETASPPPAPASAPPIAVDDNAEPPVDPAEEQTPSPEDVATREDAEQGEQAPPDSDARRIVVTGSAEARARDPLVELNEQTFELTQDIDKAVVGPVAKAYKSGLPKPVRRGLRNFFRNLLEPVNFLNYLLQFKPGKAFETLGRFTINSTIGVAGLIDVAKREPFNLPYRRNGFANTLGYYGVGPGPFLFVPLVGATTLRDLFGSLLDQSVVPLAVGSPFNTPYYAIPAYTVNSLEFRLDFDERLEEIRKTDDPYFAARESYLCTREADIAALKNRPPPRDCSIEALMAAAAPQVGVGTELTPEELEAAAAAQGTATVDPTPEPEAVEPVAPPAPPAIVYISEEVVQPLPEDY